MEENMKTIMIYIRKDQQNIYKNGIECRVRKTISENQICKKLILQQLHSNNLYAYFMFKRLELEKLNLKDHILNIVDKIKGFKSDNIRTILNYYEQKHWIIIITQYDEPGNFKNLLEHRKYLSQFQAKYFVNQFYFALSYIESQKCELEQVSLEDIDLDKNLKLKLNFLLYLKTPENNISLHQKLKYFLKINYSQYSHSQNIASFLYYVLEGKQLQIDAYYSKNILQFNVLKSNSKAKDLILKLMNKNKKISITNILSHPFLKQDYQIPILLPKTILFCPPSKQFQQHFILKKSKQKQNIQPKNQEDIQMIESNHTSIISQKKLKFQQSFVDQNHQISKTYKQLIYNNYLQEDECSLYIQQFCDITSVFGYGYKIKNGIIGFYYNDHTLIIYKYWLKKIYYFDQNWKMNIIKQEKIPDENNLKKKFYILQAYIKSIYLPKKACDMKEYSQTVLYIKSYIKLKHAKIFLLSNDTIQCNFVDKTQILCKRKQSYYFDKKLEKFIKIEQLEESSDIMIRLNYTRQLAIKLFNWLNKQKFEQLKEEYYE